MIVVSDSSVLIGLSDIDKLDLLKDLFGVITIPQKVYFELTEKGKNKSLIDIIRKQSWIHVNEINDIELFNKLVFVLDAAEAEAIILAKELKADFLLIDEKQGRKIASQFNIKIVGIGGILIAAKKTGLIENVTILIEQLLSKNFSLSQLIVNQIKKNTGE